MKARFLIPLGVFGLLVALFYYALVQIGEGEYNPRDIPSPLLGKPAPAFELPSVADPEALVNSDVFAQHPVSVLNVWASWCVACRQEHPYLMELSRRGEVPIYGLNYKDERNEARRWLAQFGDPYVTSAFDQEGKTGIDFGVYGVPETFVIDRRGMVLYKHIGPVTPDTWQAKIRPVIEQARAKP